MHYERRKTKESTMYYVAVVTWYYQIRAYKGGVGGGLRGCRCKNSAILLDRDVSQTGDGV